MRGCALGQIYILNIKTRKTRQNSFVKNSTACNPTDSPASANYSPFHDDDESYLSFGSHMPCLTPTGLQAREVGGDKVLSTTQNVEFSLSTGFKCNAESNADSAEGVCKDYEIRLCCPDKLRK